MPFVFINGTMAAGKTIKLLTSGHETENLGSKNEYYTFKGDNRYGIGKIKSRIGLSREAKVFDSDFDFFKTIFPKERDVDILYIDESQFLTEKQVKQLRELVDQTDMTVHCYGLLTDFKRKFFEGSRALIEMCDENIWIDSLCACGCGALAKVNARLNEDRKIITEGNLMDIGDHYIPMTHECFARFRDNQKSIQAKRFKRRSRTPNTPEDDQTGTHKKRRCRVETDA